MESKIIYVELKSGYNGNGPAWIGRGFYSKTGQTVYFNGRIFKNGKGPVSNHYDAETHEDYWISGAKKDGTDRHTFGSGIIQIDKSVIPEYLELTNQSVLPKKLKIVQLNNTPAKEKALIIENQKNDLE